MNTSVASLTPQTMISMVNIAALKEDNFKKRKEKKKKKEKKKRKKKGAVLAR